MKDEQAWAQLQQRCQGCGACGLRKERKNLVFGQGNPFAKVLMIVPAPTVAGGRQLLGGAEGTLFWELLSLGGITPEQVYVSSVVKCPVPKGRKALHLEQNTCLPWLRAQTKLLSPKVIVCLGQESLSVIMGEELSMAQCHGQWFIRRGVEMMGMYHPEDLLQDQTLRPQGFADIKSLEQKMKQLRMTSNK
ncbi:uracil-DNA glycosylase [Bengtsoniella intestinalis]|uniref:uracil-DNA glycosylase n=1 Tax=Bengtsoniella intestinalis TaxID=3073143 RepID=UPI00391EF706